MPDETADKALLYCHVPALSRDDSIAPSMIRTVW
jgi:hypothetical protein